MSCARRVIGKRARMYSSAHISQHKTRSAALFSGEHRAEIRPLWEHNKYISHCVEQVVECDARSSAKKIHRAADIGVCGAASVCWQSNERPSVRSSSREPSPAAED